MYIFIKNVECIIPISLVSRIFFFHGDIYKIKRNLLFIISKTTIFKKYVQFTI